MKSSARTRGRKARHLLRHWITPVFPFRKALRSCGLYVQYLRSWSGYRRLPGAETLRFGDSYPCLFDDIGRNPYDSHYFYQGIWAMERIAIREVSLHVDAGSDARFVGMLSAHLPVVFVDIRPLEVHGLDRLTCLAADLLSLPFADRSIDSLSCLHVAEHVGLGRYGDPLNPAGTRRACAELARVLAPGGDLFFSVPVGRARVCFNAHRIHGPGQILEYFRDLKLVEFSAVDDQRRLLLDIEPEQMKDEEYACGLFWFRRDFGHSTGS